MHKLARVLMGAVALASMAGVQGCKSTPTNTPATIIDNSGADPAAGNFAQVDPNAPVAAAAPAAAKPTTRVLGQQQSYPTSQSGEAYPQQQQPAYDASQQGAGYGDNYDPSEQAGYDAIQDASQPPPPLPVYEQPEAPAPNYIWTPGYWNNASAGYYWVPGAWAAPPYYGALWTPSYWGAYGGRYRYYHGYWARHIGFYGGINYGFGYFGSGYEGGYWRGNDFYYNRSVNRVNVNVVRNVYDRNVSFGNNNRVSYNGGAGGIRAQARPQELAVLREQRTPAMQTQVQFRQQAAANPRQFYSQNHGQPAETVASRPIAAVRAGQTVQGGFGGQQKPGQNAQQTQQVQQQRNAQVQQQQRNNVQTQQAQQRNVQAQQQQQQKNVQTQQVQQQQRNVQAQQQQQRTAQVQQQQRNGQAQQQQQQQRNVQAQQQQRNAQVQQQQQQRAAAARPAPQAQPQRQAAPQPQQRAAPAPQAQRQAAPAAAPQGRAGGAPEERGRH